MDKPILSTEVPFWKSWIPNTENAFYMKPIFSCFVFLFFFFGMGMVFAQQKGPILPSPSGKFSVGSRHFEIVDSSRPDLVHTTENRRIGITVYYPSEETPILQPYIDNPKLLEQMVLHHYNHQDSLALAAMAKFRKHILPRAMAVSGKKFPLLLFSHGLGVWSSNYSTFYEEWASQGFVTAAIEHPYGGFSIFENGELATNRQDLRLREAEPENLLKIVEEWAADISLVFRAINSEKSEMGKFVSPLIDPDKTIAIGHSLGGNAAVLASFRDAGIKAAINMDGGTFNTSETISYTKPILTLRSQPIYSDEDLEQKGRDIDQWRRMEREIDAAFAAEMANASAGYELKIEGAGHMSFSDAPFVLPDMIARFGGKIIARDKGFRIINNAVNLFLKKVLLKEKNSFVPLVRENAEVVLKVYSK